MLIIWLASVIIYQVFAQEAPVTVNRPKFRNQQPPWTQARQDQVRCFCNLPPCVATGYLCKSSSGGCFSDLLDRTKGSKGRHGCVEYLSESQRVQCPIGDNYGQVLVHSKSLLVCCNNDLCNHVDNPSTRNLLNDSSEDERDGNRFHNHPEPYPYSNSDVWFKAATIAVPICGAVILFVLIVLAVKILKSERDHRAFQQKLGPAMYMGPSDHKHHRWSDQPYRPCSVRKPLAYHQVHPSAFNHHHHLNHHQLDGGIHQYEMPLLLINEGNSPSVHLGPFKDVNESKNDAFAKIGLLKCKSGSVDESIMVDLGKNLSTSSVNLNSDDDKFRKSDKNFKS